MEKCPQCDNDRVPGEDFCDECGHKYAAAASQPESSQYKPSQPEPQSLEDYEKDYLGRVTGADGEDDPTSEPGTDTDDGEDEVSESSHITLPDGGIREFGDEPQTVGRSDVSDYLKNENKDQLQVSRKQFTMFKESDGYYIEDGVTSVQDKPSGNHTTVNGKDITGQGKIKLNDGDVIGISSICEATVHLT